MTNDKDPAGNTSTFGAAHGGQIKRTTPAAEENLSNTDNSTIDNSPLKKNFFQRHKKTFIKYLLLSLLLGALIIFPYFFPILTLAATIISIVTIATMQIFKERDKNKTPLERNMSRLFSLIAIMQDIVGLIPGVGLLVLFIFKVAHEITLSISAWWTARKKITQLKNHFFQKNLNKSKHTDTTDAADPDASPAHTNNTQLTQGNEGEIKGNGDEKEHGENADVEANEDDDETEGESADVEANEDDDETEGESADDDETEGESADDEAERDEGTEERPHL
jgi:hypothetical protein